MECTWWKLIEFLDLVVTGCFLVLPSTGGIITNPGSALERNWRRNKGRLKRLQNSFAGKRSMRWVRLLFGGKEQIMTYAACKIQNLLYVNQEIQMMSGIVFIPFTHSPSNKFIICLLAKQKWQFQEKLDRSALTAASQSLLWLEHKHLWNQLSMLCLLLSELLHAIFLSSNNMSRNTVFPIFPFV